MADSTTCPVLASTTLPARTAGSNSARPGAPSPKNDRIAEPRSTQAKMAETRSSPVIVLRNTVVAAPPIVALHEQALIMGQTYQHSREQGPGVSSTAQSIAGALMYSRPGCFHRGKMPKTSPAAPPACRCSASGKVWATTSRFPGRAPRPRRARRPRRSTIPGPIGAARQVGGIKMHMHVALAAFAEWAELRMAGD